MKKSVIILFLTAAFLNVYGQKSADALFRKYSGKDGYVTMTFKGNLLHLFTSSCREDDNDFWPDDLTEIRILVQEDNIDKKHNFLKFVENDLNNGEYEEFMNIKKSGQDIRILARTTGTHIKELLLVGGGKDNLLIQVKGNITRGEARRFSSKCKDGRGMKLTVKNDQKNQVTILAEK